MVAGLEQPDAGIIEIDGRNVSKTPPWQRELGMMFQQYAVFPHMSVAENVGYGLKFRQMDAAARVRQVEHMLQLVGLVGMGNKNATLLSGGEQQRVALARALAPAPKMLLLDEPLSALDERIRRAMQNELKRIHAQTGTTFLYVTHDQEEALTMSDRIAVFNRGRCVQCDAPELLYRQPRSTFVATFFRGCNVLETECIRYRDGGASLRIAGLPVEGVPTNGRAELGRHVAIRAEDIRVGAEAAACPCQLTGLVEDVAYRGTVLDYLLRLPDGQQITASMTRRADITVSSTVVVGIEPKHIVLLED
jgi:ABC-type Fe3+/spermidine/putrescine transport system ATPase subunit